MHRRFLLLVNGPRRCYSLQCTRSRYAEAEALNSEAGQTPLTDLAEARSKASEQGRKSNSHIKPRPARTHFDEDKTFLPFGAAATSAVTTAVAAVLIGRRRQRLMVKNDPASGRMAARRERPRRCRGVRGQTGWTATGDQAPTGCSQSSQITEPSSSVATMVIQCTLTGHFTGYRGLVLCT